MPTKTITTKLLKLGSGVGLSLSNQSARICGFRPGSFVRVIVLEGELRVRPAAAPCLNDEESLDDYRNRVALEEADADRECED